MYQDSVTNSQHSDQENAQYCFLDIYTLIPHKTFLRFDPQGMGHH
jgi:hypothetical protein